VRQKRESWPPFQLNDIVSKVVRGRGEVVRYEEKALTESGPYRYVLFLPEDMKERSPNASLPLTFEGEAFRSRNAAKANVASIALQELSYHRLRPDPARLLTKELKGNWAKNRVKDIEVEFFGEDEAFYAQLRVRIPILNIRAEYTGKRCTSKKEAVVDVAEAALRAMSADFVKEAEQMAEEAVPVEAPVAAS